MQIKGLQTKPPREKGGKSGVPPPLRFKDNAMTFTLHFYTQAHLKCIYLPSTTQYLCLLTCNKILRETRLLKYIFLLRVLRVSISRGLASQRSVPTTSRYPRAPWTYTVAQITGSSPPVLSTAPGRRGG